MKPFFLALLLGSLLLPTALGQEGETLLPTVRVPIALTFHGQDLVLEGGLPSGAEVFIRVRSAETEEVRLNRLGRVGIFWMPVEKAVVEGVPRLYVIASSAPLSTLPEVLRKQLGLNPPLAFLEEVATVSVEGEGSDEEAVEERQAFLEGLLKIKKDLGLYKIEEGRGVRRKDGRYQAILRIPSSISVGEIYLDVYKIQGGKVLEHERSLIQVENVGIERWLIEAAEERSLLYGIVAVLVALFAGFAVGALFKGGIGH
jgi:hypothetical protein